VPTRDVNEAAENEAELSFESRRYIKTCLGLLASLFLWCLIAVPAFADSVPSCAPDTSIASLQQSGGCESGGLLFSNFQYNNSGLQISPGVRVMPSNVLVTATPFSVTFSTDYGIGGGFTNCLSGGYCIEEEGSLGYDVSALHGSGELAGLALVGGFSPGTFGGELTEIACLGSGNPATVRGAGLGGYSSTNIPNICREDPGSSVLLSPLTPNGGSPLGFFPSTLTISVSMNLFVWPGGGATGPPHPSNLPHFSNAFLRVPGQLPEPSSLLLLATGGLVLLSTMLRK
jgi:hypothetical protein